MNQLSILVAARDQQTQNLTKSLLNGLGVRGVRCVEDSMRALDDLHDVRADVLIADMDLEPMNAIELTRYVRWRENSPNRYLAIIFMTGALERTQLVAGA